MAEVQTPNMHAPPHAPVSPVSAQSPHDNATLPEILSKKRSHADMQNGDADHASSLLPQEQHLTHEHQHHVPEHHVVSDEHHVLEHHVPDHHMPEHHIPEPYPGHGHQEHGHEQQQQLHEQQLHEQQLHEQQLHEQHHHDLHSGQQSRGESEGAQNDGSPTAEEYSSPRGSRSFKRGDPPVNHEHKFICDFSEECAGQTFERKCEWSKHMDKHDRPYRCPHPQCAKLQGFTYSGGLLRHEREVHGKHGGPKAQLMCPYEDCKRHAGKGFTRKENLNEHIRRVHESKGQPVPPVEDSSQQQAPFPDFEQGLQEAAAGADQIAEPPVARMYDDAAAAAAAQEELAIEPSLQAPDLKRKRDDEDDHEQNPDLVDDDIQRELKRLRADNAAKEDRLRMMEAAEAMREAQIKQLQDNITNLQRAQQSNGYGPFDAQIQHEQHHHHHQLPHEEAEAQQQGGYAPYNGHPEPDHQQHQAEQQQQHHHHQESGYAPYEAQSEHDHQLQQLQQLQQATHEQPGQA